MSFIVQLSKGCWLAAIKGDPGRTLVRASAKRYKTRHGALTALGLARKYRPFPKASIEEITQIAVKWNGRKWEDEGETREICISTREESSLLTIRATRNGVNSYFGLSSFAAANLFSLLMEAGCPYITAKKEDGI